MSRLLQANHQSQERKAQVNRRQTLLGLCLAVRLSLTKISFSTSSTFTAKESCRYEFDRCVLHTDLQVTGVHLHIGKSADLSFLEKRRRGLSRFANALERHPVFKSDQLVTTFLTVPTVWSTWYMLTIGARRVA